MRPHDQVRIPVPAWIRAVGSDAAHLGGEMEDELRRGVREQAPRGFHRGQVVVALAGDEHLMPVTFEPLDEMRAQEPPAAGDEDAHRPQVTDRLS